MAGNKNSGRKTGDGRWSDAVRLAAMRPVKGDKSGDRYINRIAEQLVAAAAEGDIQAIKEFGDRLDGKPKQSIDATHDVSDPLHALYAAVVNKSKPGD